MYSKLAILVIVGFVKMTTQSNIVWENLEDICYFNRSEVNSDAYVKGRCELVSGVQVQKRFYNDYYYWCIAVETGEDIVFEDYTNTKTNVMVPVDVDFMRVRTKNEQHKYDIKSDCYTDTIYKGGRELIVTLTPANKLISLKIDGLESCDQSRADEDEPVYPNQKNKNPLKYFEKCVELNSVRKSPAYSVCQGLDVVNFSEFIMNSETLFNCITIDKTFAPHKYNESVFELSLYLGGNFTARFSSNNGTSLVANSSAWIEYKLDAFLFDIRDSIIISIEPRISDEYQHWIEHIIINNEEACKQFQMNDVCGVVYKTHRPFSLFGLPTNPGQYPWHVAIFKHTNGNKIHICDGSLIENYGIVTAAHCLYENGERLLANRISMELAKYDLRLESYYTRVIRNFTRVAVHDGFDLNSKENDIALVVFYDTIEKNNYIEKICYIPVNTGLLTQPYGFVPSWPSAGDYKDILADAKIIFDADVSCAGTNKTSELCGRYDFTGTTTCVQDGAGLVVEFLSDWFLYGLVTKRFSNGEDCRNGEPVNFIEVAKYQSWIETQYDVAFQVDCKCSI